MLLKSMGTFKVRLNAVVLQHGYEPVGRRVKKLWLKTDVFGRQVDGGIVTDANCQLESRVILMNLGPGLWM